MTIYERYCMLRDERGLKDATVASIANIGKSTFSDWKSGRSIPKNEKLVKIANALEVSLDYLMTGEEKAVSYTHLPPCNVLPFLFLTAGFLDNLNLLFLESIGLTLFYLQALAVLV